MRYDYRKYNKSEVENHYKNLTTKKVLKKLERIISDMAKNTRKNTTEKSVIIILSNIDALRNVYNELLIAYSKMKAEKRDIAKEEYLNKKAREFYFKKLLKKYELLP